MREEELSNVTLKECIEEYLSNEQNQSAVRNYIINAISQGYAGSGMQLNDKREYVYDNFRKGVRAIDPETFAKCKIEKANLEIVCVTKGGK